MKTLAFVAWFAGAAALAFGQGDTRPGSAATTLASSELAAIRSVNEEYRRTSVAAAWGEWAGLFTSDAVLMPPNSPALNGRAAIEAWGRAFPPLTEFQNPIAEIEGAASTAVTRGTYRFAVSAPGQPVQKDAGKWICTLRKQGGVWKFHRCIFNSDLPPPGSAATSPADPWIGTWVLNTAKSRINPGPGDRAEIRSYRVTPEGEYATYDTIDAEGKRVVSSAVYRFDGVDATIVNDPEGLTQAIVRTGPRAIASVIKKGGQVVRTATREVSPDGKTLVVDFKGTNSRGLPIVEERLVFDRVEAPQSRLLRLTYMSVDPGRIPDYIKRIREYFLPIQSQRVEQGWILSWKAYQVAYPNGDGREYNFVIAIELSSFAQLETDASFAVLARHMMGREKYEDVTAHPIAKVMRIDTIALHHATESWPGATNRMLNVAYLKALPGKAADLMTIEREHYLPAAEDSINDGRMTAWAFGVVRFPEQRDAAYTHLALAGYASMAQLETPPSAAHREKWSAKAADAIAKLPAVRTRVKGELWQLVAETKPAAASAPAKAAE